MDEPLPGIPGDHRILFCQRDRESFGYLSNFHPAPIVIDGISWPSVEYYYQAQKSARPEYQNAIRAAVSPGQAKRLGADPALPRRLSRNSWFRINNMPIRADWPAVKLEIMRLSVRAKFAQNTDLANQLLATGTAQIVEDSATDDFWGCGRDGTGLNWLGRILMEIRKELQILEEGFVNAEIE